MNASSTFKFILLLVMAAVVIVFDEKIATDVFRQYQSVSFPTTTGRVYHSAVTVTHTSKGGTSYEVNILYDYDVDGQAFQGSRYRYGLMSPLCDQAYAAVRAHPAGSEMTVYYPSEDPSESLLCPGLVGRDLLCVFILLTANAFPLYALCTSRAPSWIKPYNQVAGGVEIISQGGKIRARLPRYPVLAWTVAVFCGASLAAFIVLSVTTMRNPSVEPELEAFGLILVVSAAVFWWRRSRLLSGVDDLVIDESARTIILPRTFGRRHNVSLDFNAVQQVYLEEVAHRSKGGYYYSWAVTLLQNGAAATERLSNWYDEEKAQAFAGWLRERLQLPGAAGMPLDSSSAFSLSGSVG